MCSHPQQRYVFDENNVSCADACRQGHGQPSAALGLGQHARRAAAGAKSTVQTSQVKSGYTSPVNLDPQQWCCSMKLGTSGCKRRQELLPPRGRGAAGARMSSLSRSFMRGLLAGDSAGGGENSNASVGPPECSCCSSSHLDTHRNTSLHTFCMPYQGHGSWFRRKTNPAPGTASTLKEVRY